jgi:hypothetical protein
MNEEAPPKRACHFMEMRPPPGTSRNSVKLYAEMSAAAYGTLYVPTITRPTVAFSARAPLASAAGRLSALTPRRLPRATFKPPDHLEAVHR